MDSVDSSDDLAAPSVTTPETRPLRVWPAIVLVLAIWTVQLLPKLFQDQSPALLMAQFMGPLLLTLLILLWWLVFSRATWRERLLGFAGLFVIFFLTNYLSDRSIRGLIFVLFSLPWAMTAFVGILAVKARSAAMRRTLFGLLAAIVAFGFWDFVRADEIRGNFATELAWRWSPTAEDELLAQIASREAATLADDIPFPESPEWPEFRGPRRDGIQPGVALAEDWRKQPPQQLWSIPIGPGWSSFAIAGQRLFTQEQRGESEVVACYDAATGQELWTHQTESRFWEAIGGAGPRATPTLHEGALFAMGASGQLTRLDPSTGDQMWSLDIRKDAEREPPQWGFSASPLVTHGLVIVHAGGPGEKGLLAYDRETGDLRWTAAAGNHSYSSPQLNELFGRPAVLTLTNSEVSFIDPATGELLGEHVWQYEGYRVIQPLVLEDNSLLLGSPMGKGTRRIVLEERDGQIHTEEDWTSDRINPYFNDFVTHNGFLYGFDNNIFTCVDLKNGKRKWKRGRYGNGQVLLLPAASQLLVLSEGGEAVLLRATPEAHKELARHRVLEGRTWNHPVVVGDRLYVRNAEQAACFVMPLLGEVL